MPFPSSRFSRHDLTRLPTPSQLHPSAFEALVRIIQGQLAECLLFGLPSLARLYPISQDHSLASFTFPPKEHEPRGLGTQALPQPCHIFKNFMMAR